MSIDEVAAHIVKLAEQATDANGTTLKLPAQQSG
jgi:hypothetical protein